MKLLTSNLIIADFVKDSGVGVKKDIFGVVNTIYVGKGGFPATLLGPWLYWSGYTELFDRVCTLEVRIRKSDDYQGGTLMRASLDVPDKRTDVLLEFAQPMPPVIFNSPGVWIVDVLADEAVVNSAVLRVEEKLK